MYSRCVKRVLNSAFVRKCTDMCKHRFGVQLLQNPPLCSSTVFTSTLTLFSKSYHRLTRYQNRSPPKLPDHSIFLSCNAVKHCFCGHFAKWNLAVNTRRPKFFESYLELWKWSFERDRLLTGAGWQMSLVSLTVQSGRRSRVTGWKGDRKLYTSVKIFYAFLVTPSN
jgi:hypothetical protein